MQQFPLSVLLLAAFCSCWSIQAQAQCTSKATIGNIDLSKPKPQDEAAKAEEPAEYITFVPLETALPGLENAPRAVHGIARVAQPAFGPADLNEGCDTSALLRTRKPVAPE